MQAGYTHPRATVQHDDMVSFHYQDYADENRQKQMALKGEEFIRRFEQHILPRGFTKIRTYGYLANRNRHQRIEEVLQKMKLPLHKGVVNVPMQVRMLEKYGIDLKECPCCKGKTMELIRVFVPWKQSDDG